MEKQFLIEYPDEPYKDTFELKNTVSATYNGFRYIILAIRESDSVVDYVAARSDDQSDLNLKDYEGVPDKKHIILDAESNPWVAAFLTCDYVITGDMPDYKFDRYDGSSWTHAYSKDSMLNEIFLPETMTYDFNTKTFSKPDVATHPLSREQFFDGLPGYIEAAKLAIKTNKNYSVEEIKILEDHIKWAENLPTTYQNVDHWKIDWPSNIPQF